MRPAISRAGFPRKRFSLGLSHDCEPNGLKNRLVPRTAAQVPGHRLDDLLIGRVRTSPQEPARRHDHPGSAEPALHGARLDKGSLKPRQLPVGGLPFDRLDHRAVGLDCEDEAGRDRLPVEEHGAGTALADSAAFLRSREVQALTDELEQGHAGGNDDRLEVPVHEDADLSIYGLPPSRKRLAVSRRTRTERTARRYSADARTSLIGDAAASALRAASSTTAG